MADHWFTIVETHWFNFAKTHWFTVVATCWVTTMATHWVTVVAHFWVTVVATPWVTKMVNKFKWETIISILVQDPKENIIFYRKGLDWSEVHGKHMEIDWIAKIPSNRIGNFIRGEEMNPDAPCSFTQV